MDGESGVAICRRLSIGGPLPLWTWIAMVCRQKERPLLPLIGGLSGGAACFTPPFPVWRRCWWTPDRGSRVGIRHRSVSGVFHPTSHTKTDARRIRNRKLRNTMVESASQLHTLSRSENGQKMVLTNGAFGRSAGIDFESRCKFLFRRLTRFSKSSGGFRGIFDGGLHIRAMLDGTAASMPDNKGSL